MMRRGGIMKKVLLFVLEFSGFMALVAGMFFLGLIADHWLQVWFPWSAP